MAESSEVTRGVPLVFFLSGDGMAAVRLIPLHQEGRIISYYLVVSDGKKEAEVNLGHDKVHGLAERLYTTVKP